jgi:uncharacterized membrane protein
MSWEGLAVSDVKFTLKVAALSAIAGMRSMSGPALLTLDDKALARTPIGRKVSMSHTTKTVLQAMAVGELIFDKLPFVPNRTDAMPMLARAASGALIGASLYEAAQKSQLVGALVGASGALAGAKISYEVRKFLSERIHIPDCIIALGEDAFVLSRIPEVLKAAQ